MHVQEKKAFKILLADENITYRNNLASKLRIQGYNVELTEGGFHLLHIMENHVCNLVILHDNMRDMSAEEIITLIRTNKTKTELPILFISSTSNQEQLASIISNGANEFLVKSDNFQPIVDRARKYFDLLNNS